MASIDLLTPSESALLSKVNDTGGPFPAGSIVTRLEAQVERTPDRVAVEAGTDSCTYRELWERSDRVAAHFAAAGVGPGDIVGVAVSRSIDMLAVVIGVLKTRAAYLPLDSDYPKSRLGFYVRDAGVRAIVVDEVSREIFEDESARLLDASSLRSEAPGPAPALEGQADDVAYIIYTSGSTGQPKGVLVTHANVSNFLAAMDEVVPHGTPGRWLAVTSLSFDIAVLELFWTLAHGFTIVLHGATDSVADSQEPRDSDHPSCSIFFFGSGGAEPVDQAYRLVLEAARFADANGFEAVWTPERHFHAFGGLYPNPSVLGAAVAAVTERVHVRAGSVVLPLHSPLRVAEEWSVVDNLSRGRVGIALASGWQPNDFVLAPERYENRKSLLFDEIDVLRTLWGGDTVPMKNPLGDEVQVRTLPRPVQPELPIWITAAGSVDTYRSAGQAGANVLTHLLGQTLDEVAEKIQVYREAYRASGAAGRGQVTLMLHTFAGPSRDAVRNTVREPLKGYLRSAASLVGHYADAWSAYKRGADHDVEVSAIDDLSEEEFEGLLDFAFERYFETSGLFGTPDECADTLVQVGGADVDEVACLIDFGVDPELVLEHLQYVVQARRRLDAAPTESVPAAIQARNITHMQCTPSAMKMVLADLEDGNELSGLQHLFLGGEALDAATVAQTRKVTDAAITNMYGPTETTVWSACWQVTDTTGPPRIGRPILNTSIFVTDADGGVLPPGTPGELRIGGAGVTKGYHNRPELTADRFVRRSDDDASIVYRTGDLVRLHDDGVLECLGRLDDQVKLRGHRVELGEVAAALTAHETVGNAVATIRDDGPAGAELVAYVVAAAGAAPDPQALRIDVAERLPQWMVPTVIMVVDDFAMTPNRKVDRNALPSPWAASARPAVPVVGSGVLQGIAEIWKAVLGRPDISPDANFFDLGGHSLLAVEVQRRLQAKFERRVPVTELFRYPTVRALAEHFAGESTTSADKPTETTGAARAAKRQRARGGRRKGRG